MADRQNAPQTSEPPSLDDRIASIRAAVASDASGELRAIGAAACRSILTELTAASNDGTPIAKLASCATEQPGGGSDDQFVDDTSMGSVLREIAHIEDAVLPAHHLARTGDVLGPYRIVRELGRGTHGVVYEAEDQPLLRTVALKVRALSSARDDELRTRFVREARVMAAVAHPNIVTVYAVGKDSGLEYLAMEYVVGVTLRQMLRNRNAPLEIADAIRIGESIAGGVDRAHELGIVHLDLKPENVMIAHTGAVKVLDFGLARTASRARGRSDRAEDALTTGSSRIVGTPAYMSPEQSSGGAVDARADVYALGVMLYELITSTRPFHGETVAELLAAIASDEPVPPARSNAQVPAALDAIVLRCLRQSPSERFASGGELAEALHRVSVGASEPMTLAPWASDRELEGRTANVRRRPRRTIRSRRRFSAPVRPPRP